jgi:hypothetical protein
MEKQYNRDISLGLNENPINYNAALIGASKVKLRDNYDFFFVYYNYPIKSN